MAGWEGTVQATALMQVDVSACIVAGSGGSDAGGHQQHCCWRWEAAGGQQGRVAGQGGGGPY